MPILYDEAAATLTLHTAHTTYQMKVMHHGQLIHTYYGPRCEGDMSYLIQYRDRGFSGNPFDAGMDRTVSCDVLPLEYPCEGNGDYRHTAFGARDMGGVSGCDLRYVSHTVEQGKYSLPGMPAVFAAGEEAQTLRVVLRDARLPVEVTLLYGVLPERDCITRSVIIRNAGEADVVLENAASAALDFLTGDFDLMHFYGRHTSERTPERTPVTHQETVVGSRRGASSHQQNPFVILAEHDAGEDHGRCIGVSLVWSGSFSCRAGKDGYDQTRLTMGIQEERFNYLLTPGEVFTAPEAVMMLTDRGLTDLSQRFHQLISGHIIRDPWKGQERPVLINNWEATYMDFTGEKIVQIAKQAAELGVDMMVLDDGWFGRRSSDHDGLGDWRVNEAKLGCSMRELAARVKALGMRFGLWIEPEMVNMASDLFQQHPDWAFIIPGKQPVRSRDQLVLDFSRREVVDNICSQLFSVLDGSGIDYIKMDMNRSINDVYSAAMEHQSQGKVLYKYVLGVYDFMERLRTRYPSMLIEGCSGGGGRFDAGMLYYAPQIWCSDMTDAIERIRIQYGTSFGYPVHCMGAHVSVSPNEQTGRVTPINTRAVVAMAGTFGYELDLNLVSEEDKAAVRQQIRDFKRWQHLMRDGLYFRLTDGLENREEAAWMLTAKDRSEALVSIVTLDIHDNAPIRYIRLKGLDAEAVYRDTHSGQTCTGAALMYAGLPVPRHRGEYVAWQIHLIREQHA